MFTNAGVVEEVESAGVWKGRGGSESRRVVPLLLCSKPTEGRLGFGEERMALNLWNERHLRGLRSEGGGMPAGFSHWR